ncbi:MAG: hypothetical protein ACMXX9_00960 [Candidatus Woesearchaeota archaeon]
MKIVKSIDNIVEQETISSDNDKIADVLNKRAAREKKFMFFRGSKHKDHNEYSELGNKGSYHCHQDAKIHTDFKRYSETHGSGECENYVDTRESSYNDTYTENH